MACANVFMIILPYNNAYSGGAIGGADCVSRCYEHAVGVLGSEDATKRFRRRTPRLTFQFPFTRNATSLIKMTPSSHQAKIFRLHQSMAGVPNSKLGTKERDGMRTDGP